MRSDAASKELRRADELLAAGDDTGSAAALERARALLHDLGAITVELDADAQTWHFGHEPAGPAGAATLPLTVGTSLTVDLADPSRLLGLVARVDDGDAPAIVAALVGVDAAAVLDAPEAVDALVSRDADPAPFRALARLAVLDRARRLDEDERGAWPLWAAEAAVLCARAAAVPGCMIRARAEAATCARTVLTVARAPRAGAAHTRLADLLAELPPLAASDADRELLARARDELRPAPSARDGGWRVRARDLFARPPAVLPLPRIRWDQAVRSSSTDDPARPPSATFPVSEYFAPWGLVPGRAEIHRADDGEDVEVRCRIDPSAAAQVGELWVRAFLAPDLTFLDSAPLTVQPGGAGEPGEAFASARLVLPPDLHRTLLSMDITDRPAEPPADSQLGLCRRAKQHGESALAAERAGLDEQAAEEWATSAELWRRGGAELQRSMAEVFAAQALDRVPGKDGDALRAAVEERAPASAWRVRSERDRQAPFVAELARPEDIA